MYNLKSISVAAMALFVWAAIAPLDASAQRGRGGRMGGGAMGAAAGRAVPRTGRPFIGGGDFRGGRFDRRVTNLPYRPYYRSFNRPFYGSFNRGYYASFNRPLYRPYSRPLYRPYSRSFYRPYYRSYYPYYRPGLSVGFGVGYPYRYGYYGSPYRYSYYYPYNYPYNYTSSYDYSSTASDVTAVPGNGYGGIRLKDAPDEAQVFVDGSYVGRAGDFDGRSQQMTLTPGSHRVEIRAPGMSPMMFNVNVIPGQTTTVRTGIR